MMRKVVRAAVGAGVVAVVVGSEQSHIGIHTLSLMMMSTCPLRAFWSLDEAESWLAELEAARDGKKESKLRA